MDTDALKKARDQVAELEAAMLAEVTEKAKLLGITICDAPAAPKQKRTRRTKAQIAVDSGVANG